MFNLKGDVELDRLARIILTIIVCVGAPIAALIGVFVFGPPLLIVLVLLFGDAFFRQHLGNPDTVIPTLYLASSGAVTIIIIYLNLCKIWGWRGILIGDNALFPIVSKIKKVLEEVQTDEQSIEIEVETPEVVVQRQSEPADKTKAKLQKLKELHNEGLINDEDYAEEKRNILKDI